MLSGADCGCTTVPRLQGVKPKRPKCRVQIKRKICTPSGRCIIKRQWRVVDCAELARRRKRKRRRK